MRCLVRLAVNPQMGVGFKKSASFVSYKNCVTALTRYPRRQLLANAAIAASRIGSLLLREIG